MAKSDGMEDVIQFDNVGWWDPATDEIRDGPISVKASTGSVVKGREPESKVDRRIDAKGGVAVPGFIDAHFHAYGISLDTLALESTPMSYVAAKASQRLRRALRRGFTTVRDVAGGDAGLARAVAEGVVPGPDYLYTGAALSQTGGHGDERPAGSGLVPCCDHLTQVVDGVDAIRRVVRDRFRTGSHAIKMMTSGGVVSPTDPLRVPQYSAEEIAAATEEAERRGSYVAAHAYSPEAIIHSIANGVRTIEHGNLIDAPTADAMAAAGAYLVPTLITYDSMGRRADEVGLDPVGRAKNQEVLDAGLASLEIARAGGVAIGFGTDLMGDLEDDQLLGFKLHCEVESVGDVLRSATSVNAEILARPDLGAADSSSFVILHRNPFDDASVLWDADARTVVHRGGVVV